MIYTISNDKLCVKISDFGAELQSVTDLADGCEYIWQGDAKYWDDRAPTLFPICGRFTENKYTYRGKEYAMGMHGFAASQIFEVSNVQKDSITMTLRDNEQTRVQYPFAFAFALTFSVEARRLTITAEITNEGEEILPATFGAHPGFNVPFTAGHDFSEYTLTFGEKCTPNQMGITPEGYYTGQCRALPLEGGTTLALDHEKFVVDGIFMSRMARKVTLGAPTDPHGVTMEFADFPYLGVWQEYGKDTPFLCLEPWCGLPSYPNVQDDITEKNDMFHIASGDSRKLQYTMEFH